MQTETKLIGRIIFANLLEYPLQKYKSFIEDAKTSPLFDKLIIEVKRFSRARIAGKAREASSNVVAEIKRIGRSFSIRYSYDGFNCRYLAQRESSESRLFHKLRRINSRNELTYWLLKGIIEHQRKYLITDNPIDLLPFSQVELVRWINSKQRSLDRRPQTRKRLQTRKSLMSEACCLNSEIDLSWISRLVKRLSVITPSGEEKPLRWFFQTRKDVNKRLIKRLLDKESEDIESGKIKKPLTDNQIRAKLKSNCKVNLSRQSVGHCRKEMGIPSAKRRLTSYKYPPLSANFSVLYPLTVESAQNNAPASSGIYEFRINGQEIEYPRGKTNVIYIGSAKNLRKRLKEHLRGNNRNEHIKYFLKNCECSFRYIQYSTPHFREKERELYKLFIATYGAPSRCNRVRP